MSKDWYGGREKRNVVDGEKDASRAFESTLTALWLWREDYHRALWCFVFERSGVSSLRHSDGLVFRGTPRILRCEMQSPTSKFL
jgi:hypothetical protein